MYSINLLQPVQHGHGFITALISRERLGRSVRQTCLLLGLLAASQAHALTLRELLQASAAAHPTVRAARFQSDAAVDGVDVAKRQYWPTLSVQAEGKSVASGASRLLRVEQTLWNGGLTGAGVKGAEISLDIARTKVDIQQQKLALQIGAAWQSLWSAQGRRQVAETSLKQLGRFEQMMRRRVQAELSVPVELELVRARVLQARVDASRAQTDIQTTIERLEQLTRMRDLRSALGVLPVGQEVEAFDRHIARLQSTINVEIDEVVLRQPEVRLAHEETLYARQQVEVRKAQALPQAYARIDQSLSGRRETNAYVGINYTTGAGFSAFLEAQALDKRAQAAEQSAEAADLEARQSLTADMRELQNARLRLEALNEAVRGSETVLDSYERQFVASRKSWQELMNAVRELGQNESARVDAETQLVGALIRLQLRVDPYALDSSVDPKPLLGPDRNQATPVEVKTR